VKGARPLLSGGRRRPSSRCRRRRSARFGPSCRKGAVLISFLSFQPANAGEEHRHRALPRTVGVTAFQPGASFPAASSRARAGRWTLFLSPFRRPRQAGLTKSGADQQAGPPRQVFFFFPMMIDRPRPATCSLPPPRWLVMGAGVAGPTGHPPRRGAWARVVSALRTLRARPVKGRGQIPRCDPLSSLAPFERPQEGQGGYAKKSSPRNFPGASRGSSSASTLRISERRHHHQRRSPDGAPPPFWSLLRTW